jgi:CarboxypepD_reg-like domain/TonB-dependent Receptor Plug Domain
VRAGLLLILLLQSGVALQPQDREKMIVCHFKNTPFTEFCDFVFHKTGVNIFYHEEWIKKLNVNLDYDSIPLLSAVKKAISGSGLEVSEWHNDLVILPGVKLLAELPVYEQIPKTTSTIQQKEQVITASEERYITGRKPGVIQTITIGRAGTGMPNTKAKILGRVLDQETGEPLISVTVYIAETKSGALTDINGFFTIVLAQGKYNVQIEYMGYEKQKYLLEVLADGNLTVRMKKAAIQMKEVVISGERKTDIRAKEPGLDQISIKSVKSLPMMMGERDILKVSGTLPGIVSAGEGSAGLNVRGSGSDQNAFFINRIPIYNTSHLFGFFPSFNSDIIKDFSVYKGHIPAQYGGRLASVFNITTRQGNRKRFTAHGGISPVTGNIVLEGPLKKDTSSFLFSARSTYSDWLLARLTDTTINKSSANFNDFSGGVNWDFRKTQVSLFMYHSYDHFRLSTINSYNYSNTGGSLILSHTYTNSLRGELAFIGSQYTFSTVDKLEISSANEHSYKMNHYETRASFRQLLNDKNQLEYGADIVLYNLDRGKVSPFGEKSLISEVVLGKDRGIESSLFISDSYDIKSWLNLDLGLRYTLFTPIGPVTTYNYTEGAPVDVRYISDTLTFGKNEPIRWYHEPDLRVAVKLETDQDGSVKLAFNQMHQNLFMLNTNTSVAPNAQWKLADYHLLPSRSNQISLGVFRTLPNRGLETSVEVFYKRTLNNPEFKDGADFLKNPLVETAVLQGNQKAYGLELFIKRSSRKLEGWLSYTYSRSVIQINGEHSWNKINNGEAFPANYDIPHSLNLVLNYYYTRRIILSSILTYQSGKPITYPESVYYIDGAPYLDYSKRNAYRIPDYIRADFSLTIEGNLRKNKLLHSSLILNLYNAAGRKNPYSVYFKTENGVIKSYMYSVIGVPIFTATWLFKLGNYAAD